MRNVRWLGLAAVLALIGCGDDAEKRSQRAAASLQNTHIDAPPNSDWRLSEVQVAAADKVVMNVTVDPGTATAFKAIPRMQSSQLAQRACPSSAAEVWQILAEEQEVWVHLIDADAALIVETRCKRN